jgi:hypothetical protein
MLKRRSFEEFEHEMTKKDSVSQNCLTLSFFISSFCLRGRPLGVL